MRDDVWVIVSGCNEGRGRVGEMSADDVCGSPRVPRWWIDIIAMHKVVERYHSDAQGGGSGVGVT